MPPEQDAKAKSPPYAIIIVTHNPELPRLQQLMQRLAGGGHRRMVFDNASADADSVAGLAHATGFDFTASASNQGIAGAVNRAVRSLPGDIEYFLTFDQDSLPDEGYCEALVATLAAARQHGTPAVAAGGKIIDQPQGLPLHFVTITPLGVRRLDAAAGDVSPDYLIISGCAFHRPGFQASGGFDPQLFVDNVDVEWCFRVRRSGRQLIGTHRVALDHRIGDDHLEAPFVNRWLKLHSPHRLQLMTRSRFLSYRKSSLSFAWKVQDLLRFTLKTTAVLLFRNRRGDTLRSVLRGAREGLRMPLSEPRIP